MNRETTRALAVRALTMATLAVSMASTALGVNVTTESFDTDIAAWTVDGASAGVRTAAPAAQWVSQPTHSGRGAAVLSAGANAGEGRVWLERKIGVEAGTHDVTLKFWLYGCSDVPATPVSAYAAVSGADVETVGDLAQVGTVPAGMGWRQYSLRKTVTVGRAEAVWVAVGFGLSNPDSQKFVIDDASVDITLHTCIADFDKSGRVTVEDLFGFLNKWLDGNPVCDMDRSGAVEVTDLFSYLNLWLGGCPGAL